jgi:acetyltransferase EpsM
MDKTRILIYGAGGQGKVLLDIFHENKIAVDSFVDDDLKKTKFQNLDVLRPIDILSSSDKLIFGIGNNHFRKHVAAQINCNYLNAIHYSAIISRNCETGTGNAIMHMAVIQSGTMIGNHCIINTKASVDHDCKIDDFVHLAPGVTLCGNVSIGELSWIGAGSVVIQEISIGRNVIIGAGSVVVNNIPDNVLAAGNPAKIIRQLDPVKF